MAYSLSAHFIQNNLSLERHFLILKCIKICRSNGKFLRKCRSNDTFSSGAWRRALSRCRLRARTSRSCSGSSCLFVCDYCALVGKYNWGLVRLCSRTLPSVDVVIKRRIGLAQTSLAAALTWRPDSLHLFVLLSRSQAGPGRNFSQPRTNNFFPLSTL